MKILLLLTFCFYTLMHLKAQQTDSVARRPEFGAELTSEFQMAHSGRCNFANLLKLHGSVPLSSTLSADVTSISFFMTNKESIGADLQTFSNLNADNIPFALSVCGISWAYKSPDRDASHSLFVGIRNMNEDYFTSPMTSFFTNSSCGIYPTISFPKIRNYHPIHD